MKMAPTLAVRVKWRRCFMPEMYLRGMAGGWTRSCGMMMSGAKAARCQKPCCQRMDGRATAGALLCTGPARPARALPTPSKKRTLSSWRSRHS